MSELMALSCPKCGAPLKVQGGDVYAICLFCSTRSKVIKKPGKSSSSSKADLGLMATDQKVVKYLEEKDFLDYTEKKLVRFFEKKSFGEFAIDFHASFSAGNPKQDMWLLRAQLRELYGEGNKGRVVKKLERLQNAQANNTLPKLLPYLIAGYTFLKYTTLLRTSAINLDIALNELKHPQENPEGTIRYDLEITFPVRKLTDLGSLYQFYEEVFPFAVGISIALEQTEPKWKGVRDKSGNNVKILEEYAGLTDYLYYHFMELGLGTNQYKGQPFDFLLDDITFVLSYMSDVDRADAFDAIWQNVKKYWSQEPDKIIQGNGNIVVRSKDHQLFIEDETQGT